MMNYSGSGGSSSTAYSQGFVENMHEGFEELLSSSSTSNNLSSLLYNLSVLIKKVQELQSIVTLTTTSPAHHNTAAVSSAGSLIHQIIGAASSMLALLSPITPGNVLLDHDQLLQNNDNNNNNSSAAVDAGGDERSISMINIRNNTTNTARTVEFQQAEEDVIELKPADLLAKYTHYCHVCAKGFKRDANLRMHMRAHGDEYKTSAALANPTNNRQIKHSYSCPEEGCRWNKKHAWFRPLKSMVCAKNHYKRRHCPKMYVCSRCGRKKFSLLSDLRTHEKHCGGDGRRWLCSCGTAFSRKDKLMSHVALFAAGHSPAGPPRS